MSTHSNNHAALHSREWGAAIFLFFVSFIFTGCDKPADEDLTPPLIEILNTSPGTSSDMVCGALSNRVIKLEMGSAVQLHVRFTDDQELGSAKFDLHQNFDCHGHKSLVWNLIEIVELSGSMQEITRTFESPENVRTGNYHLGVMALDGAGQEAEMVYFDLMVYDPNDTIPPSASILSPAAGAEISRSETMALSVEVVDDTNLSTGGYEISMIDAAGTELSIVRQDFPEESGTEYSIQASYQIPGFVQTGNCSLKVEVRDWRNNITTGYSIFTLID